MRNLSATVKVSSCLFLLFLLSTTGFAQKVKLVDDLLLAESISKQQLHPHGKRVYVFKNQPNKFLKYNPLSLAYGGSLYFYQNVISQHLSADCLYDPSCSDFSKQVVKEYGLIKGGLLSFDRLSRCNRIAATGLDLGTVNKKTHRFSDPIIKYK